MKSPREQYLGRRVKAGTAEEREQLESVPGLKLRILASDNIFVRSVLRLQKSLDLSDEHTLLLLAYHALVRIEEDEDDKWNQLSTSLAGECEVKP